MFDDVVRTLSNVKYVPKLRKRLISLGALDNLGLWFFYKQRHYEDQQRWFGSYEREKVKNLYTLIGKSFLLVLKKLLK